METLIWHLLLQASLGFISGYATTRLLGFLLAETKAQSNNPQ